MNTRLFAIAVAAAFAVTAGCGDSSVPTQDLGPADTIEQDVATDTITPVDTVGTDTTEHDTNVPDNAGTDTNMPDTTGTDTNMPDTTGTDTNTPDVEQEIVNDVIEEVSTDTGIPTTCTSNDDCDTEYYCEAETCGGTGECAMKPAFCVVPIIPGDVCACDGLMYDSKCFAAMAGVNVGSDANCGSGGSCNSNADCGSAEYCNLESCAAETGDCQTKPTLCPIILDPVCGCDGTTYNNACNAAAAGVSVDDTGAACSTVVTCTSDADCTKGFCYKTSCEAADEGTCEVEPKFCLAIGEGVCGCDGNTYLNECLAMQAGVSTDATGAECETTTSCTSNDDCSAIEYCKKSTCRSLNGVCTTVPTRRCFIGEPVCGCDGVVYPNSCTAAKCRTNYEAIASCVSTDECGPMELCGKTQYCMVADCGKSGFCMPKPSTCADATFYVCGCDGTSYKNYCEAAKVGKSIESEGKCD